MDDWRRVDLDSWADFFMALRSVLAELPPGTDLLLQPDGDARAAHVTARPQPRVAIRTRDEQLASFRCASITDVVDRIRSNVEDHWGLDAPVQLAYSYDGDVSPRLRTAFADADLVHDLPEGERPSPTAHTTGDDGDSGLAGRLSPEITQKLRRMGSSAIDPATDR